MRGIRSGLVDSYCCCVAPGTFLPHGVNGVSPRSGTEKFDTNFVDDTNFAKLAKYGHKICVSRGHNAKFVDHADTSHISSRNIFRAVKR